MEKIMPEGKPAVYQHIIPLNLRKGILEPGKQDLPIAACDCDSHCDHTEVCVIGDVPVDVCAGYAG